MGKGAGDDEGPDPRVEFVKERILSTFPKLAGAKFDKLFKNDENNACMDLWFESEEKFCLVVPDSIKLDCNMPKKLPKTKLLVLIKSVHALPKEVEELNKVVISTEIGGMTAFEHLELISNEVFLPVLSNPNNQMKWGEVATREIMDRFYTFLSSTTILCGQVKGETRLPMPPLDVNDTSNGKNRISLLEGAIITWTKQIKSVLKQDPESQLKQGMQPTPDVEIEFWKNKANNLNSIFDQLQSNRIRRVLRALDLSKSTYCTTFARLCKEVFTARLEANDNMKYLRTLEEWFDKLNGEDDFPRLLNLFKPMLHIILLIWKNSKHYNTPARLVVLMREICNSLINQACKYVSGEEIFRLIEEEEADKAVDQLKMTLRVCGSFKNTYFDYKGTANAECPANPWRIQNNALFMRLDSFLERCHDILDLTQTIVQFSKLAKIEVGGTKGKTLTASVQHIHSDFQAAVNTFKAVPYDIMDVTAKQFDDDYYEFRCSIKELERRLGALVSLAFDDCATVYGKFKLFDSFDGLLERPIIQDELEKKYVSLVQSYGQDLKTVQELFLNYRDTPPIASNLPPIAGSLTWCRGLVERVQIPMQKLQQLDRSILEREEAKEVTKVYATIVASLQEFENQKIEEWGRDVEGSSQAKLRLPLLTRNPDTLYLSVNFDPGLVKLLRETKYFLLLGLQVPDTALDIYRNVETFRAWTAQLDMVVQKNNHNLARTLPVEKPLILPYLERFDKHVETGLAQLRWNTSHETVDEFIAECFETVDIVDQITETMKLNLTSVNAIMEKWTSKPLMERKPRPVDREESERIHKTVKATRYTDIKEGGKEIHTLLKESNKVLRVSNASPDWRAYVDFVNNIVVDGLASVITVSLEFFLDQIDPASIEKHSRQPVLEIKLDLVANQIKFDPVIGPNNGKGIRDLIDGWIGSFMQVATLFRRLDNDGTYMREMHTDSDVCLLLAIIEDTLQQNQAQLDALRGTFEEHSYLWETDMEVYFKEFCEDAVVTTELASYLDLTKFDTAIHKYESVRDMIAKLESPTDIGWLRVNTTPIKHQLETYSTRWIEMFTTHLREHLMNKLETFDGFMEQVSAGLDVEVPETSDAKNAGDATKDAKNPLMNVMADIRDVRKAMDITKEMFEPLRDCCMLLKKHQVDIGAQAIKGKPLLEFLEEAPVSWDGLVKKTFAKKEAILPMQMAEQDQLKEEIETFFLAVREFRNNFRAHAPFSFDGPVEAAYAQLDSFANLLFEKEEKVKSYNELEELFELGVSKYQEMNDTRNDLRLLKNLWDFKGMLIDVYNSWKKSLWSQINTDDLETQNKNLLKQLRAAGNVDPIIKGWQVYRDIEDNIKNMAVVLPLINDLHSDSLRDRHWTMLAKVCKTDSVNPEDPKFTMDDMMKLRLHEHVDDVSEIVETAQKEKKIEKKLGDIEKAWKDFEIEYIPHKDTEMFVIKLSEEVIESLDAHQLELQTMIGMGKFVEFFKDKVLKWQATLGNVQETVKLWEMVARNWASLESIFLASADIRSQLPDDTKRFEGIDSEFKELMKEAINDTNVVNACTVEGREDAMRSMKDRLELCQKSLNEYLDVKKKIFPRFYFVSAVALLDMLANGTNPPKIMPYLGDCFDSLANMTFIDNEDGSKSMTTTKDMIAKDREVVPLFENFTMEGEVEGYLNRLTDMMMTTLRHEMNKGIEAAVNWEVDKDMPRHKWLFHFPAQIVLTGTQIYWTEESESSLEELEGGQEDAVKRYLQMCLDRLGNLIQLVLGELSSSDRCKIIALITLDVHGRDTVMKLIDQKIEGPAAFLWQQQLRQYWVPGNFDTDIRVCDFKTKYFYEWVGNTGRLVITPLTDRCYITLTMGLRLFLGGAPAGPAGTGKTETTKDLARALALPCYVFNCSDQMNYQTMADIFRGLSQTGSWGCFDEFNRIPIEVLSVVATQVKTVQDAIVKFAKPENRAPEYQKAPPGLPPVTVGYFEFSGDVISLIPTCGFWITMNPGYAGRTELPENLKACFRSCAMIRPDLALIMENMLMSEGFQTAKILSIKFFTLYSLSGDLLSKQKHYDWGLRAIKSVLRVAGGMKRAEPQLEEAQILMRALRDFNTPKIPLVDTPIFLRLISDLFMGLEVPLKIDESLKGRIVHVAKKNGWQHEDSFVLKTSQYQELLDVRHSVMLLGPTGCAKSTIWKTLAGTHNIHPETYEPKPKKTCVFETVNPKSVTGDELYGYMTLAKDWKDGVLSIIMRGMAKNFSDQGFYEYQTYKWVVLDGDIDAVWIESMNTVMDDNKVLTLVSNERVPLSDAMRMVFEINSMKNCTPATVSRAGILYINETDIGWRPMMETWVAGREDQVERSYLPGFFDKYVDATNEMVRKGYKECTVLRIINKVATIIYLLEGLLPQVQQEHKTAERLEMIFIYCLTWAFGGPMTNDKSGDMRKKFSEDFASLFGQKYPKEGLCFDYLYDPASDTHVHWQEKVSQYTPLLIGSRADATPFSQLNVETVESCRTQKLMKLLVTNGRYVMLVGTAGTGKTAQISEYLKTLDKDADGLLSTNVVMSYFTDSLQLQGEMELAIDKRAGRMFGPPATKRLIYFIDDLNLPYIETYGTQNAIALITQLMQHGSIFDRADLGFRKEIVDTQYMAGMNPTAGSFEVCERAQRHFCTFACAMPGTIDLKLIYGQIFAGHQLGWPAATIEYGDKIVDAAILLYQAVAARFLPSAVKFTYNWNMRELTNVFQGMTLSVQGDYTQPLVLLRLFVHEACRVFQDRMISEAEMTEFEAMLCDAVKKVGLKEGPDQLLSLPNCHTAFHEGTSYKPIPDMARLNKVLEMKLMEYNESNPMMDLVLFDQAMLHVSRIVRIVSNPAGNAMLIGVGGSGKQSLTKLAAFIAGYETKQLAVTGTFSVLDLKEAIKPMYMSATVKQTPTLWLMTDSQIVNDKFLIYINALLSSGWISDLFAKDEIDALIGGMNGEAKSANIPDNPEARMEFTIKRFRANFKLVLAFSPVGDIFRVRARRFPGLINCTAINFFHSWPKDALISVANFFLKDVEMEPEELKEKLANHMALEQLSVIEQSLKYRETQRRFNYVTPKSFLELIGFYKFQLLQKRTDVQRQIDRLDVGLSTLRKTAADVAELQVDLKHTMVKVEEKKAATNVLLDDMAVQREGAEKEQAAASVEAEKADKASSEAQAIQIDAERELGAAKPAMEAAAAAVDCLSKGMLTELKSLPKPPAGVDMVTSACLILIEHEYKNHKWDRAKKMMANVDQFKQSLQDFRGEDITEEDIKRVEVFINAEGFSIENMMAKSAAAANLCTWVVNIYGFNRIYVKVKPLMDSLEAAKESKAAADASLAKAQESVARVEAELQKLEDKLKAATEEKARVEAEAAACMDRLGLAERLVGGLASENERWGNEIEKLKGSSVSLVGDCMLAAGFVSYVGAFDGPNRIALWQGVWLADLAERKVPMTEGVDPLDVLVNESDTNKMISKGLPADRISIENGAIVSACKRWPLIIDPQVQGIKWLRQKEEENGLAVVQLTQKKWLNALESAIVNGHCVIIENLGEEIDATLDPVLSRAIYKKGRALFLKLGGEEVEYDPGFTLYLQTKLSNPHYKPEIAAQCTLINFIATEKGLEDQLLAKVVGQERPDLEAKQQELQAAFVQYKIQLMELEDDLLERLANAPDDILSDVPLIEGLEATKAASKEINAALEVGAKTSQEIALAREAYRKQASEGAMLYFLLTKLCAIDHMYQYSLDSYVSFFLKSIEKAVPAEKLDDRVINLVASLRMTIYTWVARGLFERHKLIFISQLCFNLMKRGTLGDDNKMNEVHFSFLMRGPKKIAEENPLEWLPTTAWQACQALGDLEEFGKFCSDLVEAAPRFREWYNHVTPEAEKLPLDWASLDRTPFQKMLVVRCLRPDRMTTTLMNYIRATLPNGNAYADCDGSLNSVEILDQSIGDSTPKTPIYFILSPGADVVGDLDKLALKYEMEKGTSYFNVSMGQGQDKVAMNFLESAHRNGSWVILNNIHLMPSWLGELEKKLDIFALEGSHSRFRLFVSSDPSKGVPVGLLARSIKLTNEPPAGLKANLKRAFCIFSREYIEEADAKTKSILFGLCHFHAIMLERKLYGPMGFNMKYPFATGDLRDSAVILANYMENSGGGKIPWEDLKYLFGEIMYGGHIVNDFDRLLSKTYLDFFMKDELLDEMEMYPFAEDEKGVSFMSPTPQSYDKYLEHIDTAMGPDTPIAFGLHPNAEIEFRTNQSSVAFSTLLELQPRDAGSDEGAQSPTQVAEMVMTDVMDKFGEKKFDVEDIARSLDDQGPYQNVFMQEMDVHNVLLAEVVRSLAELKLGFNGELTMSDAMEGLMNALFLDMVPAGWGKIAWPSKRGLVGWIVNFQMRLMQLDEWQGNPMEIPKVTWLSGLTNPQSFLTAINQVAAQKDKLELDKLISLSDVTKKMTPEEIDGHAREGAYINGLEMQGARWDLNNVSIEKSRPKEQFSSLPVMSVRGVLAEKADVKGVYLCPCYKTTMRIFNPDEKVVFCAQLKTKSPPGRWVMAGVALIMDPT